MAGSPVLSGPRVLLRAFSPDDASVVQQLAGAFEIADTTLTIPHPYEDGVAESWIEGHRDELDSGCGVTLAITLVAGGQVIGAISLMRIEQSHQAELGYWIGRSYWGKGYCSEAAALMIRYAFEELKLRRLHARHLSRNPASGRVLEKLGFTHEGRQRRHVRKWGVLEDIDLYGLLVEEWSRHAGD